jgi:hypothetical protein
MPVQRHAAPLLRIGSVYASWVAGARGERCGRSKFTVIVTGSLASHAPRHGDDAMALAAS